MSYIELVSACAATPTHADTKVSVCHQVVRMCGPAMAAQRCAPESFTLLSSGCASLSPSMAYAVLSRSYWRRAAGPRRNFARSRAPPPWQCQEGASSLLHPRVHPTIARVHKGATACGRWFKWPQDPGSTGTKWIGTRSGRCDTGSPAIWRVNPPRPSGRRSPGRLDEWSATTVPRQQRGDLHASQKASPSTRTCPAAIGSSSSTGPRPVIDNSLRDRGAACPCV